MRFICSNIRLTCVHTLLTNAVLREVNSAVPRCIRLSINPNVCPVARNQINGRSRACLQQVVDVTELFVRADVSQATSEEVAAQLHGGRSSLPRAEHQEVDTISRCRQLDVSFRQWWDGNCGTCMHMYCDVHTCTTKYTRTSMRLYTRTSFLKACKAI